MEGRYVEFVERSIWEVENNVYSRGKIIPVNQYKSIRRENEAYTSLFMFKEEVNDYVANNISAKTKKPSIEGYIGECSASYLWIDVDVEGELKNATDKMIAVVDALSTRYNLNYKSILVYFSGFKGYHIGIPTKCFGAEEYSSDILPQVFKKMTQIIVGDISEKKSMSGVDYKIYNTSRIFRCPYSKHGKTGNFKIPVDVPLLRDGNLNEMLQCSEFCSVHATYKLNPEFSESLKKLFDDTVRVIIDNVDVYADSDGYQTAISLSSNRTIFRLPQKGERNDLVYKMAYRLFAVKGLKVNEITDIMKFIYEIVNTESAKASLPRYTEMEFNTSVNSAYSRTRLKPVQKIKAQNFSSMFMAMYQKIVSSSYVDTFFDEISVDLKGGWKMGDLYSFIGKGGTMKSYLMQEELIRCSIEQKKPCLFANLEMADVEWYDRVWMSLNYKSMTDMIRDGDINESNLLATAQMIKDKVETYLHVYNGVDVDPEDMEEIIKNKEDEIKHKLSICGIDSVGGMREYGSEGENAKRLSKGLKESAKNTNTAIILINHANSSCPKATRDCSDFVRGGQKFVDNCDAYLSMSSVVDRELSNFNKIPNDIIWKAGVKYMRFVNKRGSGNTINKIVQFGKNGRIQLLPDNPIDFEEVIETGKGW